MSHLAFKLRYMVNVTMLVLFIFDPIYLRFIKSCKEDSTFAIFCKRHGCEGRVVTVENSEEKEGIEGWLLFLEGKSLEMK